MGIDASWQDENGKKIQFVADKSDAFSKLITHGNFSKASLLQYIDPCGDTTFNQLQIPTLLQELDSIIRAKGKNEKLEKYLSLIEASKHQVHTYIEFIGD